MTDNRNNPNRDDDCGCTDPRNSAKQNASRGTSTADKDRQRQVGRDAMNQTDQTESAKARGQYGNENPKGRTSQVDYTREKTGTTGTDPKRHAGMIEDDTSTDINKKDQIGGDPARNDDERNFNNANKSQRSQNTDAL